MNGIIRLINGINRLIDSAGFGGCGGAAAPGPRPGPQPLISGIMQVIN